MMSMHSQDGGSNAYGLQRALSGSHDGLNLGGSRNASGNAPFDMSDFPALAQNRSGAGGMPPSELASGSYAMHIAQQDRTQHQPDFAMQSEDFPALGGGGGGGGGAPDVTSSPNTGPRQSSLGANGARVVQQPQQFFQQQQQQQNQGQSVSGVLGGFDSASINGFSSAGGPLMGGSVGSTSGNGSASSNASSGVARSAGNASGAGGSVGSLGSIPDPSKAGIPQAPVKKAPGPGKKRLPPEQHFGLLGLLSVIRTEDADRNTLALGTDLTSLGLNLNSSESLHTSFSSPWSDRQSTRDPPFNLPACYNSSNNSAGATGGSGAAGQGRNAPRHFAKYELETLFYIFYAMPRDVAQVQAAQELYKRKWQFHVEHKVWFLDSKEMAQPPAHQLPPGVPQYIYFDIQAWERRLFTNASLASGLDAGFMPSTSVFAIGSAQQQQQQQQPSSSGTPPGTLSGSASSAAQPAAQAQS
ncbi:CCR4-NOT transcription complex subunit 2 [Hondaea fermentalgiana]|uniref:CCR4-NOT transcription complex subunit 2 n=1 Tax=Hondaea fermentalgiana TaxID=2315210 RepID=A0A2R5G7V3_9STRA|nr:CCR4-NOT transcription complex subunit 2 [Hondaea fermentalgiana]|eukprot:GBG24563.1 CCR4-NOT transcription complex subunit 2 [Hondaea fermentalgiana]